MLKIAKKLTTLAIFGAAASAFGQGVVFHDTASIEIVDMPTAIAMGAPIGGRRLMLDYDFQTGRPVGRRAFAATLTRRTLIAHTFRVDLLAGFAAESDPVFDLER